MCPVCPYGQLLIDYGIVQIITIIIRIQGFMSIFTIQDCMMKCMPHKQKMYKPMFKYFNYIYRI